jgi:hypothetical protein
MSEGPHLPPVQFLLRTGFVVCVFAFAAAILYVTIRDRQPVREKSLEELKRSEARAVEQVREESAIHKLVFGVRLEGSDETPITAFLVEAKPDQLIKTAVFKTKPLTFRRLVLRKRDGQWAIVENSPAAKPPGDEWDYLERRP